MLAPRKLKENLKKMFFTLRLFKIDNLLNHCYIIMYHMIPEKPMGFPGEVIKSDFEKHIDHLSKHYKIISLEECVDRIKTNRSLRGCVVLTFDDGFKDNYVNAFPILKKYNAPATIFLLTGRIEDREPPWFMKFRFVFMKTNRTHYKLETDSVNFDLPLHTQMERMNSATKVMFRLQQMSDDERIETVDKILRQLPVDNFSEIHDVMLTWEQIREMADNGVDFGAHTVDHIVLSRVGVNKAEEEIMSSKYTIEKNIGMSVATFAYPFGKNDQYNDDVVEILKNNHFHCAVTTEPGVVNRNNDLYRLNRFFQGAVRLNSQFWRPYN